MSNPKLLTFPELRERGVLIGRRQVDKLEAMGKFPHRVTMSNNRVAWLSEEIDEYVEAIIARRSIGKQTAA